MTQEQYDALWAQNCEECPFNKKEYDGSALGFINHCTECNMFHNISNRKPRWCRYKSNMETMADGIIHGTTQKSMS